jgi:hypothetical protein
MLGQSCIRPGFGRLISPRTINCFSAKSFPLEALFSMGTHIAFFSPSLLPGLPRALVPAKPGPLPKAGGRDCVPIISLVQMPGKSTVLLPAFGRLFENWSVLVMAATPGCGPISCLPTLVQQNQQLPKSDVEEQRASTRPKFAVKTPQLQQLPRADLNRISFD